MLGIRHDVRSVKYSNAGKDIDVQLSLISRDGGLRGNAMPLTRVAVTKQLVSLIVSPGSALER